METSDHYHNADKLVHQPSKDSANTPSGVVEISPYRRYIRFDDIIGSNVDGNIAVAYRGFDTINAIEVDWHMIDFSELGLIDDFDHMKRFADELKNIQNIQIQNIQNTWFIAETMKFNIITAHLPSLKE